jgi:hypothetical protein
VEDTNAATICDPGEYLDGSGVCSDVESRLDALFAELFARLVFVTSTTFTGAEVGGGFGAEGADMHCQRLANAAGHQGRYLAWISDDTSSPRTRFTPSEYPYRRIDGTVIANDFTDLTDGSLLAPIVLDEYGVPQGNAADGPWTGTSTSGEASTDNCGNWSGSGSGLTGQASVTGAEWTDYLLKVCGQSHRLYCFQQ